VSASVAPSTNCSASVPAWEELIPAVDELNANAVIHIIKLHTTKTHRTKFNVKRRDWKS